MRGGALQLGGVEAAGAPEPIDDQLQCFGGLGPLGGQRARRVDVGEQVPVGLDAAAPGLEGPRFGSHPLELREHLCVLSTARVLVGRPQRLVERVELGLQGGCLLRLAEGGLQLLGDLLQRGARLAQLGWLVVASRARDHAEVGRLDQHHGAERLGRCGEVAHG